MATNITAHTYYAALASAPVAVWENDALLKLANNPLGVDQTAGSWFYDGTFLYIHASDGSNVSTNGKLYDYVTASSPTYNFWDNGKSYVVMNGVDTSEVYCTSTTLFACLANIIVTGSHNTIENLATHDAWRHNFCFYTGAANNTATNLTGYNSYGDSPVCIYGPGTTNNLLQKSTFMNDTYLREANVFTGRRVVADRGARRIYGQRGGWLRVAEHGGAFPVQHECGARLRDAGGRREHNGNPFPQFAVWEFRVGRVPRAERQRRRRFAWADHAVGQPDRLLAMLSQRFRRRGLLRVRRGCGQRDL